MNIHTIRDLLGFFMLVMIDFIHITSLVWGQQYDSANASEATLKNMGKYITWTVGNW